MSWVRRLSEAWRWWSAQCAKYDRRYDALKARRVLAAMEAEQACHPAVLAFSVDALANLVGAAPGDLPPVLADLERDASVFRDDITGRYTLAPIPWGLLASEGPPGPKPSMATSRRTRRLTTAPAGES